VADDDAVVDDEFTGAACLVQVDQHLVVGAAAGRGQDFASGGLRIASSDLAHRHPALSSQRPKVAQS
jgi:hypothetical protein